MISQNAIASKDRAERSYFDHLSLVERFKNRAIRCDWAFRQVNGSKDPNLHSGASVL
jgi:hypothetical protein